MACQQKIFHFDLAHLQVLDEAVTISEDVTSDFYSLSSGYWLKNPYEIQTLKDVVAWEHPGDAFAHLVIYGKSLNEKQRGRDSLSFFRICLNDHRILRNTAGGTRDKLLPFLIYVLTHELVHIVRFSTFKHHPQSENRLVEEKRVHEITQDILAMTAINPNYAARGQCLNK